MGGSRFCGSACLPAAPQRSALLAQERPAKAPAHALLARVACGRVEVRVGVDDAQRAAALVDPQEEVGVVL
jgi:hypothetical protein